MPKLEWTTLDLKHAAKVKIIGDNGPVKIIIGGPQENGLYWWHIKVEEKGYATTIEEAKQLALDNIKHDIEEAK